MLLQDSSAVFAIYMFGYATYLLFGGIIAIWNLYKNRLRERMSNELNHTYYFPVSILVPAFNEEKTILTTISNLLKLDYKIFEIVIIDDGSTDNTAKRVVDTYNLHKNDMPVRLQVPCKEITETYSGNIGNRSLVMIKKINGGCKADAINAGINISKYPYFVSMDADEVLQADALKYSAKLFLENDHTIGVGGLIGIANGVKFERAFPVHIRMTRNHVVNMQILEYYRSFMASRVFNDTFNGNLNISGGYGLFKKESVILVGGYDPDSVGEDMDLVLRLHIYYRSHHIPYLMKYTSDAVCWTQAPFTIRDLKKQRARWQRGMIQCMWKHKVLFFNPKYGVLSFVPFTYYLLYELLAPFFELAGFLVILASFLMRCLNIRFAITISLLYLGFSVLQTLLFFISKYFMREDKYYKGDFGWCIYMCLADVIFFRPLLFFVRIGAFLDYKKNLHSWHHLEREDLKAKEEPDSELAYEQK